MLAFFRRQNGRVFFPSLPIAALPPAAGAGQTQMALLGMLRCGWVGFVAQGNRLDFFSVIALGRLNQRRLDIFAMQKASGISYPRWPFQRAMRPVAEWRSFLLN